MVDASSDDDWGSWKADGPPSSSDKPSQPTHALTGAAQWTDHAWSGADQWSDHSWAGAAQWSDNRWQSSQACEAAGTDTAAAGSCDDSNWGSRQPAAAQWSSSCTSTQRPAQEPAAATAGDSKTKAVVVAPGARLKASAWWHAKPVHLVPAAAVPKQQQGAAAAGPSSSKAANIRGSAAPNARLLAPKVSNVKAAPPRRPPARPLPIKPAKAAQAKAVPIKAAPARPASAPATLAAAPARATAAPVVAAAKPIGAGARATAAHAKATGPLAKARPPPLPWPPGNCHAGHSLHIWDGNRYTGNCFLCKGVLPSKGLKCRKCDSIFCMTCREGAVNPVQPVSPPLQQPARRPASAATIGSAAPANDEAPAASASATAVTSATAEPAAPANHEAPAASASATAVTSATAEPAAPANDEVQQAAKRRRRRFLLDEPPSERSCGTPAVPEASLPRAAASTSSPSSASVHSQTLQYSMLSKSAEMIDDRQSAFVVHRTCSCSTNCCRCLPAALPPW